MEEEGKKITVGGILSWAVVGLAGLIIVLLVVFLILTSPPSGAKSVLVNDALASAKDATVWYQKRYNEPYYPEGSRFAVNKVRYIKPVNQWQITVQANTSVFRELAEKKKLSKVPDDFSDFVFVLKDDNGREYTSYDYADFSKTRHRYRRLIFDQVSGSGVSELVLDIYYKDETEPVTSIRVYDKTIPLARSKDKISGETYPGLKHFPG